MYRLLFVILLLFSSQFSFAYSKDTSGSSSLLYRGTEYTKIISPQIGTPFLYSDKPVSAKLSYYGAQYDSVEIQYDIENDIVVTRDLTGQIRVRLVSEKLSSFTLGGHRFTRVAGTVGFYEILYSGKRQVFVKWQKVLSRKGVEEARYETYKQVFVQDSKGLSLVSNRNDLMEIFGKDKKRAMEYAKAEHLNFKKDLPDAVTRMVSYADKNGFHD